MALLIESDEEKLLLARADDAVQLCQKKNYSRFLGFLNPRERILITRYCKKTSGVNTLFFGGYDDAERTVFCCFPDFYENCYENIPISLFEITGRDVSALSHRDYLGSLLALGIKREKVGDILSFEDKCYIFVLSDIKEYIIQNLEKIGNKGVKCREIPVGLLSLPEKKTENIRGTVSSLRLDCIVSLALRTSRSKVSSYILSGNVSVNFEPVDNLSFDMGKDDILSLKGHGRYKLSEIGNLSKKGRINVTVQKFL